MKKRIKNGIALLAGTAVCLGGMVGVLPTVTASAGKSEQKVVTEEMYKEQLSKQKWEYTRDISHEEGKIIFEKSKTGKDSQIVSTVLANDLRDMGIDTCVNGRLTVKITDVLDGEFYIAFGLSRPYSQANTASAICLYDMGGEIGVKVENFAGEDVGTVYTSATAYAYGTELTIDFDVYSVGSMQLSVNGDSMLNHDNAKRVLTNGYFGFGQSAPSSVEIYNAEIRAATYDTPANSNFTETFSDGFNSALLYSEGGSGGYYSPQSVVCENGVLKFNNVTAIGYISTRQEYSNFTMTYDIPHIQRQAVLDDEGNVITPATNWMGVSIGCSSVVTNSSVAVAQSLFFFMMPVYQNGRAIGMSCSLLNNYATLKTTSVSGDKNFFAVENGVDGEGKERTVNLKVEMKDGLLQVFSKYEGEPVNRYQKLFDYNLGYTPLGYVQIWGYGDDFNYVQNNMSQGLDSYCANFWLDNLKMENTDVNANLVEVDFVSSKFPEQDDFVYVDRWNNRAETLYEADPPAEKKEGCKGTASIASAYFLLLVGGALMMKKGGKEE
ncbi:MAG: hypothetical protein E7371_05000 [Clostridiales bacterium]|nr:hypothetical protein [Clostridiales bacterium]